MEAGRKRTRTVSWEDPFEVPKAAAGRSGLELLRDVFSGKLPPPPITVPMGLRGVEEMECKAVFEREPGEHIYRPTRSDKGGPALALLDSPNGCGLPRTLQARDRHP